ncbi:MAG: Efflux transporter, family [Parcubacteria group bacterium]|nr:Efflux transporter, family [Parcubacteria group bacterium]
MKPIISWTKKLGTNIRTGSKRIWVWFKARKRWQQVTIVAVIAALVVGGVVLARSGGTATTADQLRTVTVQSVNSLEGGGDSVSVVGNVRSVSEANLLAQAGGTVEAVHAQLGSVVPAGFVIAELNNDTERAQVLQAQGAYDAAIAAGAAVSPQDADTDARNAYKSTIAAIDSTLTTQVDLFFGNPTPFGPQFVLKPTASDIETHRQQLDETMTQRSANIASANTRSVDDLLNESQSDLQSVSSLLDQIAAISGEADSHVTPAQNAALASARASINAQLAAVSSARAAYRAKSTSSTASVDANVKSALGSLRLAQANLEKTVVRAPIGGTVNFLPIHVGDYVTQLMHVATVANNGSLEIVAFISQDDRANITTGMKVRINDSYDGIITTIAPALDPTTKQIEVDIAVSGATNLENGQSVRIGFASALPSKSTVATSTTSAASPILLPLAAVKLSANQSVVFTVDGNDLLVAHIVKIGNVISDRIEITNGITPDLMIVTDARGLSEGEKVQVSTSTQASI